MKKSMLILILAVWCSGCVAQNFRIQKVQAFYTVTMPGMARADEKGNTIDPQPIIDRLVHYFLTYKNIPGEEKVAVDIDAVYGAAEAHEVILQSREDYRNLVG